MFRGRCAAMAGRDWVRVARVGQVRSSRPRKQAAGKAKARAAADRVRSRAGRAVSRKEEGLGPP